MKKSGSEMENRVRERGDGLQPVCLRNCCSPRWVTEPAQQSLVGKAQPGEPRSKLAWFPLCAFTAMKVER